MSAFDPKRTYPKIDQDLIVCRWLRWNAIVPTGPTEPRGAGGGKHEAAGVSLDTRLGSAV
jgi:hypothetical protein